jgi:hypothetical protein
MPAFNDASGVILQSHATTPLLAADAATESIRFQNVSGGDFWLRSGAPATRGLGSFWLKPGDCIDESYLPVDVDIYILGYPGGAFTLLYS